MPARRSGSNSMPRRALAGRAGKKKVLVSGFLARRQQGKEIRRRRAGKPSDRAQVHRDKAKQDWLGVDSESDGRRLPGGVAPGPFSPRSDSAMLCRRSCRRFFVGEARRFGRTHCCRQASIEGSPPDRSCCQLQSEHLPATLPLPLSPRGDFSPACHSRRPRRALTPPCPTASPSWS